MRIGGDTRLQRLQRLNNKAATGYRTAPIGRTRFPASLDAPSLTTASVAGRDGRKGLKRRAFLLRRGAWTLLGTPSVVREPVPAPPRRALGPTGQPPERVTRTSAYDMGTLRPVAPRPSGAGFSLDRVARGRRTAGLARSSPGASNGHPAVPRRGSAVAAGESVIRPLRRFAFVCSHFFGTRIFLQFFPTARGGRKAGSTTQQPQRS